MTAPFGGPWSRPASGSYSGHFGHFVSRHANCAQKEMFQVSTDLISCICSIGIILTLKPKWYFCVKSYSVVHEELLFSLLCECVSNLIFFPKITSQSKTGRTKDHILYLPLRLPLARFGVLRFPLTMLCSAAHYITRLGQ